MADKPQSSTSTAGQRNVPKIKRPATTLTTEARRAKLKSVIATANKLPLKATVAPPAKPGSLATKAKVVRPPVATDKLNDQYELYLQNYLLKMMNVSVENVQMRSDMDSMITKGVRVLATAARTGKSFSDKVCIHIWEHLKLIENIRGAFVDLVDFTGEETLVEIQSILSSKYEKILVEGAALEQPVFQSQEIENMVQKLKTYRLKTNDEKRVAGFCRIFSTTLAKLKIKSDETNRGASGIKKQYSTLLECFSLFCSDLACMENIKGADRVGISSSDDDDDEDEDKDSRRY